MKILTVLDGRGEEHDQRKTEGGNGSEDGYCVGPPGDDEADGAQYFADPDHLDG